MKKETVFGLLRIFCDLFVLIDISCLTDLTAVQIIGMHMLFKTLESLVADIMLDFARITLCSRRADADAFKEKCEDPVSVE